MYHNFFVTSVCKGWGCGAAVRITKQHCRVLWTYWNVFPLDDLSQSKCGW